MSLEAGLCRESGTRHGHGSTSSLRTASVWPLIITLDILDSWLGSPTSPIDGGSDEQRGYPPLYTRFFFPSSQSTLVQNQNKLGRGGSRTPSRSLLIGCVHVGQAACLGGSGVVICAFLPIYYHLDTTVPPSPRSFSTHPRQSINKLFFCRKSPTQPRTLVYRPQ